MISQASSDSAEKNNETTRRRRLSATIPSTINFPPVDINLRIFSVPGENRYKAELYGHRVLLDVTPDDLRIFNESLANAAAKVYKLIGASLKIDTSAIDQPLQELAREGNYVFHEIFKDKLAKEAIRQLLNDRNVRTIEVQSSDFFLPWELLYDGDPDFFRFENFWGFRYILSRFIPREMSERGILFPELITLDVPSIALQTDSSLPFVMKEEIPFFENLEHQTKIRLFKLRALETANLNDEKKAFARFCETNEVQISHYACHAIYKENPPHHSFLKFTNKFPISIMDIRSLQFELAGNPLLFLNACETGIYNPLQTLNFVDLFLDIGARGVIVTETDVSDSFAAYFSKYFYELFLSGEEVGNSLLKCRQYFLREFGNPLGLIYGLYGDPAIRIRQVAMAAIE